MTKRLAIILALSISTLISGCHRPRTDEIALLLLFPCGGFLLLMGLGIFLSSLITAAFRPAKRATADNVVIPNTQIEAEAVLLKTEEMYITWITVLFLLSFFVPFVVVVRSYSSVSVYDVVLLNSLFAGLTFAGTAWLYRRYDGNQVKPIYAGLFGFFLYFLITFGYFLTSSELPKFYFTPYLLQIERIMLWDQLPYVSFVFAPLSVMIWRFRDFSLKGKPWSPILVIHRNLLLLWGFLVASILIITIMTGQTMLTLIPSSLASGKVTREYDQVYIILSNIREVFFFNSCHDLLIAMFITLGLLSINKNTELFYITISGIVVGVMVVLMVFYLGQKATLDYVVNNHGGTYMEQVLYRNELIQLHSLYPSSEPLRNLLISLTAGAALVFILNVRSNIFVHNETITGDKIAVGNITGSKSVSIGKEISSHANEGL